jgi:FKBP-type peptidyl-prolyl cis-trans isomerase SlyD
MTEDQEAELESQADDVDAASGDDSAADQPDDEGLQAGDFVTVGYTARTVEGGQLVDTTDPEVAADEGVEDEDQEFAPRTIVLGEGHVFDTVEDAIIGGEVGDEDTVTVSAQEAFGEYDPEAVETISADKIDEDDRYPGAHIEVDDKHGHITTIIGGRARVDFNHPLAGEDVEYDYEILEVVEDKTERAKSLFNVYLDMEPTLWLETDEVEEEVPVTDDDDADADVEGGDDADEAADDDEDAEPEFETQVVEKETLYVEATPQLTMNQQWMMMKQQMTQDMIQTLGIDRIIVQEIFDGMPDMGMPGMMGGMGGMGGGLEEALEDEDVDADEILEELDDEDIDLDEA